MADESALSKLRRDPLAIAVLAVVTAVGGGTGSVFFGRPDPFTGTDGRKLEARIVNVERAHYDLRNAVLAEARKMIRGHQAEAEIWKDRILVLEHECRECKRRLDRAEK